MLRAAIRQGVCCQGEHAVFGDLVKALSSRMPFDARSALNFSAQAGPGLYEIYSGFSERNGAIGFRIVYLKTELRNITKRFQHLYIRPDMHLKEIRRYRNAS